MPVPQGNDAACPFMPRFVNLPQANFCGGLPLAGNRNFPFLLVDDVGVFLINTSLRSRLIRQVLTRSRALSLKVETPNGSWGE